MQTLISWLLAIFFGLTSMLALADTEIIQLHNRSAAELLPKIQSFLEPYERASDWGQQLIIQADPQKIEEIRQLIQQLDTKPRRLLISVDSGSSGISNSSQTGVSLRGYSTSSQNSGLRSVQTVEGSPALIQTGQQIQQKHWSLNQHGQPQQQVSQRNLKQGFYVVASVHDNRATLDLYNIDEQLDSRQANIIHSQSSKTRINIPLNQWQEISGVQQQTQQRANNQQTSSRRYSNENNNLKIKVELLD